MKNIIKNQKGAITLFVLVSMLFMTMFLITIYTLSTNNEIATRNAARTLKDKYEVGLDRIDEIYDSLLDVRAFDKEGNEIEDIESWNVVFSDTTKGFRVEYTGDVKPYYIIADGTEGKITEYVTILGTYEKQNDDGTIVKMTKKQLMIEGANIESNSAIRTIIGEIETDTQLISNITMENSRISTTSMSSMFYNCTNLESIDLGNLDTSNVKTMKDTFRGCTNLKNINFGDNFTTINVTNMASIFNGCEALTELDLTTFNTSKVINMTSMFEGCKALTELDLTSFNTSTVTDMSGMFKSCKNVKTIDINKEIFKTNLVTGMYQMFQYCINLQEIDVTGFSGENVGVIEGMFDGCYNLTSLGKDEQGNEVGLRDFATTEKLCKTYSRNVYSISKL